jgi:hypothetical protein
MSAEIDRELAAGAELAEALGERIVGLAGRAVPYRDPTVQRWVVVSFEPGTSTESLVQEDRLRLLQNHSDEDWPIGVSMAWSSGAGLDGRWRLALTPEAQLGRHLARDGIVTGLSGRHRAAPAGLGVRGGVGSEPRPRVHGPPHDPPGAPRGGQPDGDPGLRSRSGHQRDEGEGRR